MSALLSLTTYARSRFGEKVCGKSESSDLNWDRGSWSDQTLGVAFTAGSCRAESFVAKTTVRARVEIDIVLASRS